MVEKFNLINQILENEVNTGANIDTSLCIRMVLLAQNQTDDSLLAIGYNMVGSFNGRKGDYSTALEYLFRALPLAEKSKDYRRISSVYFDISLTYIIMGKSKEARYYNLKGRTIYLTGRINCLILWPPNLTVIWSILLAG